MMNKAVVSTNSGSTQDLFHENNFQLVETKSADALFEGVKNVLDKKHQINPRNYVVNNFSLNQMTRKILSVYKGLLS